MSRKIIDWEGIRKSYQDTELPVRSIAKAYLVDHSTIVKKAKKESWTRIVKSSEITKTVTKTVTSDMVNVGENTTGDVVIIDGLKAELDGVFAKMFFDVVRQEMEKKYYTYDYFSVFIAAEFFQKLMNVRKSIPQNGVTMSPKSGQTYVSGEFNVYISAASNFVKVTKDLGLSPLSRGRATLKVVESMQQKGFWDEIESNDELMDELGV